MSGGLGARPVVILADDDDAITSNLVSRERGILTVRVLLVGT
jgi:hypothetical protein